MALVQAAGAVMLVALAWDVVADLRGRSNPDSPPPSPALLSWVLMAVAVVLLVAGVHQVTGGPL